VALRKLHPVVSGDRDYAGFASEYAKIDRARAKAREREAERARQLAEHRAAVRRWEQDREEAMLEGRDPDPEIRYPGEFAGEPAHSRPAAEVLLEREISLDRAFRKWSARRAPEFRPAITGRDAELAAEAAELVRRLRRVAAEMGELR
jgi:hypothetical protein